MGLTDMKTLLISGIILGLSAGLSPGPMLTLVITQTLQHGIREGMKVACAPLLTDIPIIIVCLGILSAFANMNLVLGVLALIGGVYLFYLGMCSFRFSGDDLEVAHVKPESLKKGVMINFLNPSPYMFWTSIGGPLVLKSPDSSLISAMGFILPFYVLLVGSKIVVAVISGKSKNFLKSNHYRFIIRFLGLVLIGFGVLFWRDGIRYILA